MCVSWPYKRDTTEFLDRKRTRYGSFYLHMGVAGFGVGSIIYSCLQFGEYFDLSGDCQLLIIALKPTFRILFMVAQTIFIFSYTDVRYIIIILRTLLTLNIDMWDVYRDVSRCVTSVYSIIFNIIKVPRIHSTINQITISRLHLNSCDRFWTRWGESSWIDLDWCIW